MTDKAVSDSRFGEKVPVLDEGYVILLDVMGDDECVVDAARISYDRRGKTADRVLLRYLMRNRHTSPFVICQCSARIRFRCGTCLPQSGTWSISNDGCTEKRKR